MKSLFRLLFTTLLTLSDCVSNCSYFDKLVYRLLTYYTAKVWSMCVISNNIKTKCLSFILGKTLKYIIQYRQKIIWKSVLNWKQVRTEPFIYTDSKLTVYNAKINWIILDRKACLLYSSTQNTGKEWERDR